MSTDIIIIIIKICGHVPIINKESESLKTKIEEAIAMFTSSNCISQASTEIQKCWLISVRSTCQ